MTSRNRHPCCFVCSRSYKYGEPGPYLLPCLHSVCHHCREGHEDITCNACGKKYSRADNLPTDAVTRKDVFLTTVEHNASELLCTNREDGNQAMSWCEACEAFLCEHCQASHEDMKATKNHKVMSLQDLSSRYETVGRAPRCTDHTDHPYTFYDTTCKIPICAMCALGKHRECNREELDVTCSSLLASLEEKIHVLRSRQELLLTRQCANKQHGLDLAEKQQQLEDIVTHTFNELRNVLSQRELEIKIQLELSIKKLLEVNIEQQKVLEDESTKHCGTHDFIEKCLKMADPLDLLAMKQTISERTDSCVGSVIPEIKTYAGAVNFCRQGQQELKENIGSFGAFFTHRKNDGSDVSLGVTNDNRRVIVRKPIITMDRQRMNSNLVHIDERGFLVCGKDPSGMETDPECFSMYYGTVSREPLSTDDLQYWEMKIRLEVLRELDKLILFETGITVLDAVEQQSTVLREHHTFIMFAARCDNHSAVCIKSREHGRNTKCLKQITAVEVGTKTELHLGFAFIHRNKTIAFLDISGEEVLCVLDNIHPAKEYWPVFAVFNGEVAKVEIQIVSDNDITIDTRKMNLLDKSL